VVVAHVNIEHYDVAVSRAASAQGITIIIIIIIIIIIYLPKV